MSATHDYPFADLSEAEFRRIVQTSHFERSRAALAAMKAGWRHLLWLFAPAGRPWRAVFRRRPALEPEPPRIRR